MGKTGLILVPVMGARPRPNLSGMYENESRWLVPGTVVADD